MKQNQQENVTLYEIRHKILEFLTHDPLINPDLHESKIDIPSPDRALKKHLIIAALESLEKIDFVKKVETPDQTWWILVRPLGSFDQTLEISFDTALGMATVINGYCQAVGNTSDLTDATSIKEKDVEKMILILDNILNSEPKKT